MPRGETYQMAAVIRRERTGYSARCAELDVASAGETLEQAVANLRVAVKDFLETAHYTEIAEKVRGEIWVTTFMVTTEK